MIKHYSHHHTRGFSLAELLVVVTIISILSTVVLGSVGQATGSARDAERLNDIRTIKQALELFHVEHGRYPGLTDGVAECGEEGFIGVGNPIDDVLREYISEVPRDPMHDGVNFFYAYDARHMYAPEPDGYDGQNTKVFGVNRFEGGSEVSPGKGTYEGGCMNLRNAHFNIAYCDYETTCEETSY